MSMPPTVWLLDVDIPPSWQPWDSELFDMSIELPEPEDWISLLDVLMDPTT